MGLETTVRAAVRDYNTDFTTRAWVALTMGVLSSLVVYIFTLLVCFTLLGSWWFVIATAVFAVFFAVSWRTVRGGVDPADGVRAPGEDDWGAIRLAMMATGRVLSPRHTIAGAAGVVLHGPASILEGLEMKKSVLPETPEVVAGAAAALEKVLAGPIPLTSVSPPVAALVLVRSGLAKLQGRGEGALLAATVKAREAAGRP